MPGAVKPGVARHGARGGFTLLAPPQATGLDARFDEHLLEHTTHRGPVASIWQAARSLVVPRTYRRFSAFDATCARFAQRGWPVAVRQTGGGIVPQGPGILNLSLAYRVEGAPMRHSEPGYQLICKVLADALAHVGIDAFPAAVEGSFCDGRYNLAVTGVHGPVKIAGTAQMWRRIPGTVQSHVGLVHALILVDVDCARVTALANEFEAALGSARRYRSDRVTSLAATSANARALGHDLLPTLQRHLEQQLACCHDALAGHP